MFCLKDINPLELCAGGYQNMDFYGKGTDGVTQSHRYKGMAEIALTKAKSPYSTQGLVRLCLLAMINRTAPVAGIDQSANSVTVGISCNL